MNVGDSQQVSCGATAEGKNEEQKTILVFLNYNVVTNP
jgi:hypothetical protein